MKKKQLKRTLNSLLNGSCRQLSPKILFHKHFGGPPIGVTHSCRLLLSLFIISIGLFIIGTNITVNTSALTYSENVDVNFTFEPSINMSLSYSDLIIEDLVPGSYSDSNIITVSVSTNNIYGYNLAATAGNGSTYTSTDLVHHNNTDNDNTNNLSSNPSFTSLSPSTSIPSMSDASPNEWGYSYSTDNGSSWSYYSGLPYYTSPGSLLALSNTNGESSVKFKIGAKADNWQMAGEYNNVINFYAVTNSTPSAPGNCLNTATCMQTMTECPTTPTTVTDARDGSTYKVQRLADGNCWMLDNLALDLTNENTKANMLSTVDTKTNATYEQLNYLFNGGGTTTDQWPTEKLNYQPWTSSSQNYYSIPMIVTDYKNTLVTSYGPAAVDGKAKVGIYYNYCAASAGTYCWGNGTSETGSPTSDPKPSSLYDIDGDVCPANWRMPTSSDDGDYRTLCSAINGSECTAGDAQVTSMDASSSTSMQYQLSTSLAGTFSDGVIGGNNYSGRFWAATWQIGSRIYRLDIDSSSVRPSDYGGRVYGRTIRCLMKPTNIDGIVYLQDMDPSVIGSMETGRTYIKKDKRDGQSYHVAKLADGKVWMLDNLALDLTDANVQANLTPNTTNATEQTLSCLKTGQYNGATCSSPYTAYAVAAATSTNYYDRPAIDTSSINVNPSDADVGPGNNKVGVYYNYCATSAGSYCYPNGSGTGYGDIAEDICPAGWRLPTGDTNGEFTTLYNNNSYNTYASFKNALSLPLSGVFYTDSAHDQGNFGSWWSSTRYSSNIAVYDLYLDTSSVRTPAGSNRNVGFSIRCLLSL